MRSTLTIVTLISALLVMAASMAVVYKLIPVQAAALISIIAVVIIGASISRRPKTAFQAPPEREIIGVLRLIWPLLLGAVVGIFGVWSNGWRIGDSIGVVVCFLLLAAYVLAFRRRGTDRSSHRG